MRHVVFVLIAALCFGTTGTAKELGPDAGSLSVGATRIVIGGLALAAIALVASRRSRIPSVRSDRPDSQPGARGAAWPAILFGALGVVAYQPAFFLGTSLNGVAVGTILALGSAPIITGLLEWLGSRRFPGLVWAVATSVATAGIVLLSGAGEFGSTDAIGLLASLGAGTAYAVYALAGKRMLTLGWTPTRSMGAMFGWAAVGSVPLMLATDLRWVLRPDGIAMALWLGLVTTTLAYLLFARGLKALTAATVSTLTLAEPLTATVLGVLLLHEQLTGSAIGGVALVTIGLGLLASWRPRRALAA